jgi:AraC-like DNA-binding protein
LVSTASAAPAEAPGFLARTYVPGPPLGALIEKLWLYEGYTVGHARERLLPMGTMELVINLREDESRVYDPRTGLALPSRVQRGALLCGAHSESFIIDTDEQQSVIGVHFKPGGAAPFLGVPAGELHNRQVGLEDLWGGAAPALRERLVATKSPEAKLRVLERALLARAKRPPAMRPEVGFALGAFAAPDDPMRVRDVVAELGWSPRRFIRCFEDAVGLTPKLYARVQRFQGALARIHARPAVAVDWTAVAAHCGYFDQAHFIRDFRGFAGLTPTEYAALCLRHTNHVPLA